MTQQPATVTSHFKLGKSQGELDFVDVTIDEDVPLFVDPFAISLRPDQWSQNCAQSVQDFFHLVLTRIQAGDKDGALALLRFLREPNETRLGLSSGKSRGAGIGGLQAQQLYDAFADSAAVKTGFLSHLEEAELMIAGIGRDKISDLTTNIIRRELAAYTKEQCELLGIPTQKAALPPYFDRDQERWLSDYFDLPVVNGAPLVLVPKIIVRYDLAYNHDRYYRGFVVDFLQAEALNAGSSLVTTLKSGQKRVYKKDIQEKHPLSKEFLYRFSKEHPEVLQKYRAELEEVEKSLENPLGDVDDAPVARALIEALQSIPPGGSDAGRYHSLMIGVLEFLFFPHLLHPVKEREIHQGRKRIDIVMENGARPGATFHALHAVKKLPAAYVAIECKNYSSDVSNPELDQLAGRFSPTFGKIGLLCCRTFDDRSLFVQRCKDTFKDDRGLILPLDDAAVVGMLELAAKRNRRGIDTRLRELVSEVWL
jgi:hypothetical protein